MVLLVVFVVHYTHKKKHRIYQRRLRAFLGCWIARFWVDEACHDLKHTTITLRLGICEIPLRMEELRGVHGQQQKMGSRNNRHFMVAILLHHKGKFPSCFIPEEAAMHIWHRQSFKPDILGRVERWWVMGIWNFINFWGIHGCPKASCLTDICFVATFGKHQVPDILCLPSVWLNASIQLAWVAYILVYLNIHNYLDVYISKYISSHCSTWVLVALLACRTTTDRLWDQPARAWRAAFCAWCWTQLGKWDWLLKQYYDATKKPSDSLTYIFNRSEGHPRVSVV